MNLNDLLKITFEKKASDLHVKVGVPPILRIDGKLTPIETEKRLTQEDAIAIATGIMNPVQKAKFNEKNELDMAYAVPGLGRFRVNVFKQRGSVGMVFRMVPSKILNFEELMLPTVLTKIASEQRGLILVTGTTGSGKSTTLAAAIDYINTARTANIITIEDPIEFLHRDKKSIVNQREIGSRYLFVQRRTSQRAPSGPRCDPRRRNEGLRNHLHGVDRGGNRASRALNPAYPGRSGDDQPDHNRLSSLSAKAGPDAARLGHQGHHFAAACITGGR